MVLSNKMLNQKIPDNLVKKEQIQVDTNSKEEEDGLVLYVAGIPYQCTEDEIRSYFRGCGVITKVDCMMRPEDGAFSGIAYITFETEDGANRALAFGRDAMSDGYLTIQQHVPEMVEGYNNSTVYIENLAWDTRERDMCKLFSDCVINSVELDKNIETGEFNGCAHVDNSCTNPNFDSYNVEETYADTVSNIVNNENYFATRVSSGNKMKRRTCYVCREKGHISTACPKKLQESVNARPATFSYDIHMSYGGSYMDGTCNAATNEAHSGGLASSEVRFGKKKRRTCREKGHLSTARLKKKKRLNF